MEVEINHRRRLIPDVEKGRNSESETTNNATPATALSTIPSPPPETTSGAETEQPSKEEVGVLENPQHEQRSFTNGPTPF